MDHRLLRCLHERLTVLEETGKVDEQGTQDVTDVVTRRTALLGCESGDVTEIARVREDARRLYRWRSNLMHGRSSPLTKELSDVMHLAHRITQQAMFAALAIFVQLDMAGKVTGQDLEDRFVKLERTCAPLRPQVLRDRGVVAVTLSGGGAWRPARLDARL